MKRKINRVGISTLTVSLPSKWVKANGLKAGQELEVLDEGKIIHIFAGAIQKNKKVNVCIDNYDSLMLKRLLNQLYINGINEITITFSDASIINYKTGERIEVERHIKELIPRFIGLEVISQGKGKVILQNLLPIGESENIEIIQKRAYFLIKEFLHEFINNFNDFKQFYSKAYDYHDTVDRFVNYYLRLILASDLDEANKSREVAFYEKVRTMLDKVRHTAERISEMKKITPKIKEYVAAIFGYYISQFNLKFQSNISAKDISHIVKQRYELIKKINNENFTLEEARVVQECKIMLDTVVEFLDDYLRKDFDKFDLI